MGGLEAIISSINEQAGKEADVVLKEAEETKKSVVTKTANDINKMLSDGEKKAQTKAELEFEKIKSAAVMEAKQDLLRTKQKIIAEIIEKAYLQIANLPDKEYFDFLIVIATQYIHSQSGIVRLNKRDLERMPKDFEDRINAQAESIGGTIKVSMDAVSIRDGMILDYGDIEENCTLAALFDNKKEKIQDMVNKFLFS